MKADFWNWFDAEAAPRLALREPSFRKTFRYLDQIDGPLVIVETGCARVRDNWAGDGQSTVLFDRYLACRQHGGRGFAIDLDPKATALCEQLVSSRFSVLTGDSVLVLLDVASQLQREDMSIDLLYLDSYDVDWANPVPSGVHHLKELVSIVSCLRSDTLVVVDDAPASARLVANADDQYQFISMPQVGGKGTFVAEYAAQVGAKSYFSHYQAAWTGLVR